ncbi:copper resistance protein CopC [Paenibacillus harenae]|uniref:copper resistance protein CopC n=1 Tax=Paenibacillus harenae TaxID=306543 RepID=UPI00040E5EAC|nr:copper resistance protein CopC [Paenibacillus harenae]
MKRLALIFFLLAIMIPLTQVDAHSPIEKRFPNVNAVMETSPEQVELLFEDPVQIHRSSVIVRNEKEEEVQVGKAQLDPDNNRRIFVAMQQNLPSGKYTVDIDVVAMDGHALKEKYTFEVKVVTATPEERFQNLQLVRTTPEDGTIVQGTPTRIEVWYNEDVDEMPYFGLLNDKQQMLDTAKPTVDPDEPKHYVLELDQELDSGTYAIHFYPRIGDRTTVNIVYFAVDEFTSITGHREFSYDELWDQLGLLQWAHWLSYFGLLTLTGGALFRQLLGNNNLGEEKRWVRFAYTMYGLSVIAIVMVLVMYRVGYSQVVFNDFINFNFVWITMIQLLTVCISIMIKKLRLVLLSISVLCEALIGHSVDPAYGGAWAVGADLIHLLASAVWIGGLSALLIRMPNHNGKEWLQHAGRLFSKWALVSYLAIGLSGIIMTINYVPAFSTQSLLTSYWGQVLIFKVLLFLAILLFAVWQRRLLKKVAETMAVRFKRNVRIEIIIAVLILLGAGFLVDLSPKEAVQNIEPASQTKEGITASVQIYPFKVGANDVTIQLNDDTDIAHVRAKFSTNLGGAVENNAFKLGDGFYKITGNIFHGAGTVKMELQAIKSNGERLIYPPFTIQMPGFMPNDIEIENEG